MKMKTIAVVALIVLGWSAAASAGPFEKVPGGGLRHKTSGVIFPARVGLFRFEGTKLYGSAGRDVGAAYDFEPTVRGDVYVYPLGTYGKDFNAEVRVQQNAINRVNKSVKLVSQSGCQLNQMGRNLTGIRVQYDLTRSIFQSKARRCGSQLYLFRDGPWLVAYRFSYPIEQGAAATKSIADFLRLWQWRVRGTITRLEQTSTDGRHS
jgi:hypothetical protein